MRRPVGVKWILLLLWWTKFFSGRVATVATLPSALLDERFASLGASWVFSFQPVLPPVCRPLVPSRDGSWARPLTQSPELGAGARCFHSMNLKLCGCRQWHRSAVAQRFVSFSTHPQAMQQHGQLSRRRNHRSLLSVLPATLRQLQPPAPQIAVRSKRPRM